MNYKLKSLGYKTDFIFNSFDGTVEDKGNYIVATTKSNPHYFWGNLLLYKSLPNKGDLQIWKDDFKKEFKSLNVYHITLAWDSVKGEVGECQEFLDDGFELSQSVVLTTQQAEKPPKYNEHVDVSVAKTKEDYARCIAVQVNSADKDHLSKKVWEDFYTTSMAQYQVMVEAHRGFWFIAKIDGEIVGSLGIFTDGSRLGRYQLVSTDPEFQRQGVCSTLVYESAQYAFKKMNLDTLVMVADEDYHAAKIYESVGFRPTEKMAGLCWWDKEKHK